MFTINDDKSIYLTRGDIAVIEVGASSTNDEPYTFKVGDIVRFSVFEKGSYDQIVIKKDVSVEKESPTVDISLYKEDTKIGDLINKPKDYWYEIELNPETYPQTIIGYDTRGPKIFRLYPEGNDINGYNI